MKQPDREIIELLDSLMYSGMAFALYRLPWDDDCRLVVQTSEEAERLMHIGGLDGRRGFVISPFRIDERHPLVLIRPDEMACGWQEIGERLKTMGDKLQMTANKARTVSDTSLISSPSAEGNYRKTFDRFIDPLCRDEFRKLVLSRAAFQPIEEDFSPTEAFLRATVSYPRMMIYLCHTSTSGTWMGSTPEILLSGRGRAWHTVALAGTMPMLPDGTMPTEWSVKNQKEQVCVAEYIRRIVSHYGSNITEEGPYTSRAGALVHLKTDFRFHLDDPSALYGLLHELHPTPAVCGLPKEEALQFILDNEGYDRRYYSGFIGWLEPAGQTDLYVNLRCMELTQGGALLYAGGGILPSSEVDAEWRETEEKMKTMRRIVIIHSS